VGCAVLADELRSRYVGPLLERLSDTRYPSATMMDRIEAAITDRAAAEDYVNRLLDIIDQDQYPSPSMLDRVNRLIARLGA
jgi:hypothetical protein